MADFAPESARLNDDVLFGRGFTRTEMAGILTYLALCMAQEAYADDGEQEQHGGFFGQGKLNTAYCQCFIGNSYLKPLTDVKDTSVFIANVTFAPGGRNNWHIHHARSGGGRIPICADGAGL